MSKPGDLVETPDGGRISADVSQKANVLWRLTAIGALTQELRNAVALLGEAKRPSAKRAAALRASVEAIARQLDEEREALKALLPSADAVRRQAERESWARQGIAPHASESTGDPLGGASMSRGFNDWNLGGWR
jgi:hypothetical protein